MINYVNSFSIFIVINFNSRSEKKTKYTIKYNNQLIDKTKISSYDLKLFPF